MNLLRGPISRQRCSPYSSTAALLDATSGLLATIPSPLSPWRGCMCRAVESGARDVHCTRVQLGLSARPRTRSLRFLLHVRRGANAVQGGRIRNPRCSLHPRAAALLGTTSASLATAPSRLSRWCGCMCRAVESGARDVRCTRVQPGLSARPRTARSDSFSASAVARKHAPGGRVRGPRCPLHPRAAVRLGGPRTARHCTFATSAAGSG